jgi:hypothetical protein
MAFPSEFLPLSFAFSRPNSPFYKPDIMTQSRNTERKQTLYLRHVLQWYYKQFVTWNYLWRCVNLSHGPYIESLRESRVPSPRYELGTGAAHCKPSLSLKFLPS